MLRSFLILAVLVASFARAEEIDVGGQVVTPCTGEENGSVQKIRGKTYRCLNGRMLTEQAYQDKIKKGEILTVVDLTKEGSGSGGAGSGGFGGSGSGGSGSGGSGSGGSGSGGSGGSGSGGSGSGSGGSGSGSGGSGSGSGGSGSGSGGSGGVSMSTPSGGSGGTAGGSGGSTSGAGASGSGSGNGAAGGGASDGQSLKGKTIIYYTSGGEDKKQYKTIEEACAAWTLRQTERGRECRIVEGGARVYQDGKDTGIRASVTASTKYCHTDNCDLAKIDKPKPQGEEKSSEPKQEESKENGWDKVVEALNNLGNTLKTIMSGSSQNQQGVGQTGASGGSSESGNGGGSEKNGETGKGGGSEEKSGTGQGSGSGDGEGDGEGTGDEGLGLGKDEGVDTGWLSAIVPTGNNIQLDDVGVCPQPIEVDLMGLGKISITWEYLCQFAEMIRPVILLAFAAASLRVLRSLNG